MQRGRSREDICFPNLPTSPRTSGVTSLCSPFFNTLADNKKRIWEARFQRDRTKMRGRERCKTVKIEAVKQASDHWMWVLELELINECSSKVKWTSRTLEEDFSTVIGLDFRNGFKIYIFRSTLTSKAGYSPLVCDSVGSLVPVCTQHDVFHSNPGSTSILCLH